ncbi:MAG: type II secretion system F family protein [Veillonella dispar]|mgnify:FL=1|uniref:Bacterial type II secretion system domain protein F n=1 Tax=Veillonella dispar ATCC 17748 TaxID=546273 RepID=C4FPY1_9FIRM|nr:type II secretion system F family protein [Veillonella dispar]MDU2569190.1 type II secretion system F family protein [Veillonella sp.]EEP65640.1 bacterial type II secretion system domain protein F [Veillonella dispar ATCC 17748]MDU2930600.1 type II secretion system F family protein [Veillonella sp.]MDU4885315.1 type II secretion system F family protein [Veillonella dispar]VEG93380.1 type IV pilin biogenesis protein [Veillonella dispar]
MEAYEYVVKDENNETIKGLIWADSEQEVGTRLKRDGYKIYKITLQVNKKKHKWNHTMVVDVTYQLGLLIESGVPLRRALQLLCQGKRGLLYTALYESIERGQTLSQALRSESCPAIALALLESGEAAGTLGESLQYISRHYDWERQLRQKVISAISYPLFLLVLMNIFFLVTILFIIPSFEKVFTTMHITLPVMTRSLFALGQGLKNHPIVVVILHCVGLGAMVFAYRQYSIKRKVHRWLWQLAHRYQWMTCIYYTSMLKVWALLLDSGISIIHTMNITRPLWGNMHGSECSEKVEAKLLSGHSLEESLRTENIGNSFIWQMISIGEESGELVKMLEHCGHYYESILSKYIARLERLLEPILLTLMGIGVAVLVVSVMYPLFTSIAKLGGP